MGAKVCEIFRPAIEMSPRLVRLLAECAGPGRRGMRWRDAVGRIHWSILLRAMAVMLQAHSLKKAIFLPQNGLLSRMKFMSAKLLIFINIFLNCKNG